MKRIASIFFIGLFAIGMASCKKVENKVEFLGGTSPALSSSVSAGSEVTLDSKKKEAIALTLNWTNPNYKFNTGISSQDVSYVVQIDTVGANFSSSLIQEKSVAKDLSMSFATKDLNNMLLKLKLPIGVLSTFEVRLEAYLGSEAVPYYSNVLTLKATPFLDIVVPLPTSGELYLVGGDPLLGNWANGGAYANQNQQFTEVDATTFSITVNLSGGDNTTDANQFLILPVWGNWDHKFSCKNTADQPVTGGEFGFDLSSNFPAPPTAGTYKIVMDFKLGTYTVTKQ